MNFKRLFQPMLLMMGLALTFGIVGCAKSKENAEINAESAKDFGNDMDALTEIMDMALDIAANDPNVSLKNFNESPYLSDNMYKEIEYKKYDSSLTDGDGIHMKIRWTKDDWVNWQDVPQCRDGIKRRGTIEIYVSANYSEIGGIISIDFDNFSFGKNETNFTRFGNGNQSKAYDNKFRVNECMKLTRISPNGWAYEAAHRKNKLRLDITTVKSGEETETKFAGDGTIVNTLDNNGNISTVEITGTSEGFNRKRNEYFMSITTTLLRKYKECPDVTTFVSGVVELSNESSSRNAKKPLKIDFGKGDCDNKADVTQKINGLYTHKETIEF